MELFKYKLTCVTYSPPIKNFEGKTVSGISISVPVGRIENEKIEQTAEKLKETALEISRSMGYSE